MKGKKKKDSQEQGLSFTKKIVIFILVMAEIEVFASYILAFLGKADIAETLSAQIVVTVVGTIIGYFVKSLVENIFKNNEVFKKKLKDAATDEVKVETELINKIEKSESEDESELSDDETTYGSITPTYG